MKPNIGAGDKGQTSLLYGGRVSKNSPRPEAYGTVDEVASILGLAKALCTEQYTKGIVHDMQKDLFLVSAELATESDHHQELQKHGWIVSDAMVARLVAVIADIENRITMPKTFTIPGATAGAAVLDMARSTVRRAERRVVALMEADDLPNANVAAYLNRAADVLFALARYEEAETVEGEK